MRRKIQWTVKVKADKNHLIEVKMDKENESEDTLEIRQKMKLK
jgi:hypothetical protein